MTPPTVLSDPDETATAPPPGGRWAGAGGSREAAVEPGPGTTVDRYVVLGPVGSGGMGEVYKAYDPHLDRVVALKFIRRGGQGDRMVREARALAQVSHPNVIAVHDVGLVDGSVYLAMEYVPGPTLRQWLAPGARRRPDEVLRVLAQAGEGLAAAHRAGVAHRDFKGSNVLVGDDGRARVIDFGLARTMVVPDVGTPSGGVRAVARDEGGSAEAGRAARVGAAAEAALTRGDQVIGTPRYMAPEQHLGGVVSSAADQYAFCVVLWEALAGEHPYGPGGGAARFERMLLGAVQAGSPGAARIPRHVRRTLERGLRPEPAARWPSMEALLGELRRGPAGRRRAAAGALAAIALLGAAAAGASARGRAPEPCPGGEARFAGVWDERAAEAVRSAFERSGWPGWRDEYARVKAGLDAHAGRWAAAQRDACRATRVTGAASEEQFDRRMGCLERRLAETRAATGLLAGADRELATRAAQVVGALGDAGACLGNAADAGGRPRPSDPAVRARVDALDAELERAGVLREAGRVPDARAAFERAAAGARGLGHAPVLAEALVRLGEAQALDGDGARALATLDEALGAAGRAADDALLAEGLIVRGEVLTGPLARARDALALRPIVLAAVERAGATPRLLGRTHLLLERAHDELGNYDEALAHAREALRIAEASSGAGSWAAAMALRRLASVERLAGATADARRDALEAVGRVERLLGADHPRLYDALLDAASAERSAGNAHASEAMIRRALALYEAALPEHPHLSNGYRRLGASLYTQGRFAEAEAALSRAAALARLATPPGAMVLADVSAWLGYAAQELRGVEAARPHYEQARAYYRAGGRTDDPFLGEVLALWGEAECKAKHEARAAALFAEARAILAPRNDNWSAKLLVAEAECLVASRRAPRAVAAASAAVAKLAALSDDDDTADARFVLARALWETGARRRAAAEARRALALLGAGGGKRADEYRAWLAAHPGR